MVMVVVLIVTMVTLPIEIAFFANDIYPAVYWRVIHLTADIIFLADVILNFRTGYIHTASGEVRYLILQKSKNIFKHLNIF